MHYICLENNAITSILNYQPNVPESITVIEISDDDAQKLFSGDYTYDIEGNKVKKKKADKRVLTNQESRTLLDTTDWMVLRHIREKALGVTTSLTDEQYLELEQKRHAAAEAIKQ